jgi:predicted ATPase/DNA-binding CsgD family transcriptional regulator
LSITRPDLTPLRQEGMGTGSPNNLPAQPTPIIGREQELASLTTRLLQTDPRLITLIGPAGVGKTRLAIQAAAGLLSAFPDGVWYIGLASIDDPNLIVPSIAQTLGLHTQPGQSDLDALKDHLRSRAALLILDNFEQVMPAAQPLAGLMAACPTLKLLVTSRSALHLRGEQEFPVPPLTLPTPGKRITDPEALQQYSAIALFQQCAASVRPNFAITPANAAAVVDICSRLDGLPLAIELVAARVKMLQPHAILHRLEHRLQLLTGGPQDLPTRQQTLRSAIEWSYDLLTGEEQVLFRRLAVFVGGCTLEAAEAICARLEEQNPGLTAEPNNNPQSAIRNPQSNVLDGIGSLIDKSLLRQVETADDGGDTEPHYAMLETIREYALEQLERSGEAPALRQAHAAYFMQAAESAEPLLTGAGQKDCLDRLDREHDNLRAALRWSLAAPDRAEGAETGLRLCGALGRFWSLRDYLTEGRDWIDSVLSMPEAAAPTLLRARALTSAGRIADNRGDYPAVRHYSSECLSILRLLDHKAGMAGQYILQAKAASDEGSYEQAISLLQQGIVMAREANDRHGLAHSLNGLGEIARLQGDYNAARRYYSECLQIFREMDYGQGIGFSVHNLAHVCLRSEAPGDAAALLEEGMTIFKELGNRLGIAMCVSAMAGVALYNSEPHRAARLLGAAQALLEAVNALLDPADMMEYRRNEDCARASLGEAAFLAAWAEGHAMTPDQVMAIQDMPTARPTPRPAPTQPSTPVPAPHLGPGEYPDSITTREADVLRLVARGLSDADVAGQLFLSPHTVRAHLRSIYSKIGVTSRTAATRYATDRGIT